MILAVISTSVGIAADTTTVLMARDAIGDFIRHLRSWIGRRAGADPGSELTIEVSAHSPNGGSQLRLVVKSDGSNVPEVDMDAVVRLLHAAFLTHQSEP